MNFILATPMEVRLAAVFVLGVFLGSAINLAVYRLAWFPRPISPWSRPDPAAPSRQFLDRLPVVGWLGLRREAGLHGRGFWIRPMLLELLTGLGLAAALLVGNRPRRPSTAGNAAPFAADLARVPALRVCRPHDTHRTDVGRVDD